MFGGDSFFPLWLSEQLIVRALVDVRDSAFYPLINFLNTTALGKIPRTGCALK